ncbi:MAG TPA: hypothetical protein VL866_21965 [Pyrinomonadaceae bacterium]|nr:hypothetical protein [Pyrinomonadaceae bacterium]
MSDMLQLVVDVPSLNATEIAQRVSDMLQLVVDVLYTQHLRSAKPSDEFFPVVRTFVKPFLLG